MSTLEGGTYIPQAEATYGQYNAGPNMMTGLNYGSWGGCCGVNEEITYNNLNQVTSLYAPVNYSGVALSLSYNYSEGRDNGRVTSIDDYVTSQYVHYTYDSINRVTAASAGSTWAEAYTYDGFGNLTSKTPTAGTAPAMSASYNTNNQQIGLT